MYDILLSGVDHLRLVIEGVHNWDVEALQALSTDMLERRDGSTACIEWLKSIFSPPPQQDSKRFKKQLARVVRKILDGTNEFNSLDVSHMAD